jgi:hypothetical protein
MRNAKFWLEDLKGRKNLEDISVDRRITIKRTLRNIIERVAWTRLDCGRDMYSIQTRR